MNRKDNVHNCHGNMVNYVGWGLQRGPATPQVGAQVATLHVLHADHDGARVRRHRQQGHDPRVLKACHYPTHAGQPQCVSAACHWLRAHYLCQCARKAHCAKRKADIALLNMDGVDGKRAVVKEKRTVGTCIGE